MPSASRVFFIELGTPTPVESTVTIIEAEDAGTPGALRILTHPDTANFPPITYSRNPDDDFNVDNDVLVAPLTEILLTEGTTHLSRHVKNLDDGIVTEVWNGGRGQASMPTSFFRLLYEYWKNPPAFSATNPTFITWQPRDRNSFTYNVEIVSVLIGRGRVNQEFHTTRVLEPGGAEIPTAQSAIENGSSWLVDTVALTMRIVGTV